MDISVPPLAFIPYKMPLQAAKLLQRRDRFLADVVLEETGEETVAYCVNPGRMEAFSSEGARVWLLPAPASSLAAGRRLRWTWELLEHDGTVCCANTQRPNHVVRALLAQRSLPGLDDWVEMASERSVEPHMERVDEKCRAASDRGPGSARDEPHTSRLDFWLRRPSGEHYIEVKNCHLVYPDGHGYFPDSISQRASRRVQELASLAARGVQATALFVVGRSDLRGCVRPSEHHDPVFARACRAAAAAGVNFRAVRVSCSLQGLAVDYEVPVDLVPYDVGPILGWVAENRSTTGWIRSSTSQRVANGPFPHEVRASALLKRQSSRSLSPEKHRKVAKARAQPNRVAAAVKGKGHGTSATSFSVALVSADCRIEL